MAKTLMVKKEPVPGDEEEDVGPKAAEPLQHEKSQGDEISPAGSNGSVQAFLAACEKAREDECEPPMDPSEKFEQFVLARDAGQEKWHPGQKDLLFSLAQEAFLFEHGNEEQTEFHFWYFYLFFLT